MYVFAIASAKGGVGKSTIAANLAVSFAVRGARTLLIDLDPQGAAAALLGVEPRPGHPSAIATLSDTESSLRPLPVDGLPELTVVAADPDFDQLGASIAEGRLRQACAALRPRPKYVILDLAPSLEPVTVRALSEADAVVPVVQATANGARTIPALLDALQTRCPYTAVAGLLLNHFGATGSVGRKVAERIRGSFGRWVLPIEIPMDDALQEAALYGQPVLWHDARSPASTALLDLADHLARYATPTAAEATA